MTKLDEMKDAYDEHFVLDNKLMLEWYPHRVVAMARGHSLLELGLGHGFSTAFFARHFSRYKVIEGSPEMIERFRSRFEFGQVDIVEAYFEDFGTTERFDNIAMGFILEHVDDPALILRRYRSFLTPGGSIFIAVPNSESLHRRFGHKAGLLPDLEQLSQADHDFGHQRYFSLRTLTKLVEDESYSVVKAEGIFLKPITTQQITDLKLAPEILQGMLKVGIEYPELSNAMLMQIQPKVVTRPETHLPPADNFGLTFDHFGLATRDPAKTVAFLRGLGYHPGETIHDPLQKVNLIMCPSAQMPPIEVIFPCDERGPLDAILANRTEALYHICYRSRDLATSLAAMKQAGHRVIQAAAPQPAILFDYKRVSFYVVKGFGLIEIIED